VKKREKWSQGGREKHGIIFFKKGDKKPPVIAEVPERRGGKGMSLRNHPRRAMKCCCAETGGKKQVRIGRGIREGISNLIKEGKRVSKLCRRGQGVPEFHPWRNLG